MKHADILARSMRGALTLVWSATWLKPGPRERLEFFEDFAPTTQG
ncbi:MAG: hypothetical protein AAF488_01650 [Planctomycetota bacterium]